MREDAQDAYSLPVAQRMHTLDASHQWTRASLYLHEPGTFLPLARLDEKLVEPAFLATGTDGGFVQVPAKSRHATVFYQNDHLGTPQELLDESGKVVWLARYKAWGGRKPTPYGKTDAAEADNAIRFQGQYADDETGLTYNRHRYYDPQTGRFISKDPIGLAGGINVYQYAPNPVQWIDPLGLRCDSPANKLARKLRALQKAQGSAANTRRLPDGRIRYYDAEVPALNPGPTRGRSHVTEWNPGTGQVRSWEETYNQAGEVNRVHPKMDNGEVLDLPHYPPTKADLDQGKATASGRATSRCP